MKIAYISDFGFSFCDFPLIQQMNKDDLDVTYYILINSFRLKGPLFQINADVVGSSGIYPASTFPEFEKFNNILELNKVYVVYSKKDSRSSFKRIMQAISLRFRLLYELISKKYDIIHHTYPLELSSWYLYLLSKKMVLTMHDPFPHSNDVGNTVEARNRRIAYRLIPKIILLNNTTTDSFIKENKISREKVFVSRLGEFSFIREVKPVSLVKNSKYILQFGAISPYKGIEYLINAFNKIYKEYLDVKLVIAGGGKLYFKEEIYKDNSNIIIINRYLDIQEIAGLLRDCLFSVCPYKDATQSGVIPMSYALNVPMIVTNVGALPVSVENDVTGIVVPPCDSDALAEAIKKLLDNPKEIDRMRNNIDTIWKPANTWGPVVNDYINCYKS